MTDFNQRSDSGIYRLSIKSNCRFFALDKHKRILKQLYKHTIRSNTNLRHRLLAMSNDFEYSCILDSNDWKQDNYHSFDLIAGFGNANLLSVDPSRNPFDTLREFHDSNKNWLLGYLSYDLKNSIEKLESNNKDQINAPLLEFFIPKLLVLLKDDVIEVLVHEDYQNEKILIEYANIIISNKEGQHTRKFIPISVNHRIQKSEYLDAINSIRSHIKHGDVYELNSCQEFYAENVELNSAEIYKRLIEKSPTPYSALCHFNQLHLISASPERYIKLEDDKIISQPIKGTARRVGDDIKDEEIKVELKNNLKERAENIMIVDLVRNDLSRVAESKSVVVKELCEIYSFKQVHQMISTIEATKRKDVHFVDVLKNTFPMGSMTGAPKIRAMELIEKYEYTKRGLFSGAVGYITPSGDFDFNVVIRSISYNSANKYLSFITGGAITYESDPMKEYEESLLKAEAIFDILS